jgi:hypothetical protein
MTQLLSARAQSEFEHTRNRIADLVGVVIKTGLLSSIVAMVEVPLIVENNVLSGLFAFPYVKHYCNHVCFTLSSRWYLIGKLYVVVQSDALGWFIGNIV